MTVIEGTNAYPPSIQKKFDTYANGRKLEEMNVDFLAHSAEAEHDVSNGITSGLTEEEVKVLSELDSVLAEEYKKLQESDINKENLKNDKLNLERNASLAKQRLDDCEKKDNWFLNLFRSDEENAVVKLNIEQARSKYEYYSNWQNCDENVISYQTLLTRSSVLELEEGKAQKDNNIN